MTETWRDVSGYEGSYQISNLGRVKSLKDRGRDRVHLMSPTNNGQGYLIVALRKNAKRKNHYIHRLVAEAFVENQNGHAYVNHLDYDTQNNRADNLQWCSQKENVIYSSHKMRKRKTVTHSNTGEKYISYRSKTGKYRLTIDGHEVGAFGSLEDAIKARNDYLKEVI